ncbi:TrmH family RNA methyltransferase [Helicobacter suis]|uniref:TrmH family RNA methyltransferase n=1 Tax=Helicobacter suis TaxID=104628 RepID=UPI0013D3C026|nr:TrmH family RNA methyltransferase [Helicobacter suis]
MIVFGKQVVLHMLMYYPDMISVLYLAKEVDKKTFNLFRAHQREYQSQIVNLDFKKAQAMAKGANHQGFLAKVYPPQKDRLKDIKTLDKVLVLCGLSDVGNVGALFRSVAALGFEGVILDSHMPYEGLVRSSLGALYDVPFCVCQNILDVICELKEAGVFCYGAHVRGQDVKNVVFTHPLALFLGSEGIGLNSRILNKMDQLLHIKMQGKMDSLNVSVAGAILMDRVRG